MLFIVGIAKDLLDLISLGFLSPLLGGVYWLIVIVWGVFQGPKFLAKAAGVGVFLLPAYGVFFILEFIPGIGNFLSVLTPDTTISSFILSRLKKSAGILATAKSAAKKPRSTGRFVARVAGFGGGDGGGDGGGALQKRSRITGALASTTPLQSMAVVQSPRLQEGGHAALERIARQPSQQPMPVGQASYRPPEEVANEIRQYLPKQSQHSGAAIPISASSGHEPPGAHAYRPASEQSRTEQIWEEIKNPERLDVVGSALTKIIPPVGPGSVAKGGAAAWSAGIRYEKPVEEIAKQWASKKSLVGNAAKLREHFKQGGEVLASIGKDGKVRILNGNTRVYGAQKSGLGAEEIKAAYTAHGGEIVHGTLADALKEGASRAASPKAGANLLQ